LSIPSTRGKVKILLLGSGGINGRLLTYRRNIRDQLKNMGYANILIMEDISNSITDGGICQKFADILRQHDPHFIFAFFHRGEKMDAVAFEIGYVCALYDDSSIRNQLKFLHEEGYDFANEACAYIDDLLPKLNHSKFNDDKEYSRAIKIIHRMIAIPE